MLMYTVRVIFVMVAITLPFGNGFVMNVPSNHTDLHLHLDAVVSNLVNLTQRLQVEIQSKNDLTQFLQRDVRKLNSSLTEERQRRESLENRVKQLEESFNNQLASNSELKDDLAATKNLAKALQTELLDTKHKLDIAAAQQTNINATCTQGIQRLDTEITTLFANIIEINETLYTPTKAENVFFTYRSSDSAVPTNSETPLKFHEAVTDEGNGYSEPNGTFTAPFSGTYWFGLTLGVDTDSYMNCYIVKNDKDHLVEVFSSGYNTVSASSSANVHLNAGDKVVVGSCSGTGKLDPYKSSFSGLLVHKDD